MTVRPSSRPRVKILQVEHSGSECGMDSISRLPLCSHLLQQTLRGVCIDSEWVYSVFWRILPRNFPPPKWELGGYLDRSKANKRNWILVWEDGFCDFARSLAAQEGNANSAAVTASGKGSVNSTSCDTGAPAAVTSSVVMNDPSAERYSGGLHPELFFKMSHEVYNYGEGLMGKVAADNGHKWVYKDPPERDNRLVSFWHSTIDPQPRIWEAQFKCGIQTIVVIAVREGLVQLGSTRQILEDLNFVVLLQRKFNNLQQAMNPNVVQPASSNFGTNLQVSSQYHGTSPDSLERKMRHGRPDRDESPFRRTLERRLSWSGTVSDSRRSRPAATSVQLLDDLHHHLGPPLADQSSASSSATSSSGSPWYHRNPLADANSSFSVGGSTPLTQHGAGIRSSSCAASKSGSGGGGVMSVLPSMTNLQVLLSNLPAVTSSNLSIPLPHQFLNSESDVLVHSPLLRTLSAPAPASAASAPPPHEYPADLNRPSLSSVSSGAFHMPQSATSTVPAMMGDHHPFLIVTPPRHEYDEVEDDKATLCSRTELKTKATLCSRVQLDTKAFSKVQVDLHQPAAQLTPGSQAAAVASATTDQSSSLRHEQLGNAILRQGAVANVSSSPESFDENLITDLGLQADKMLTTYLDDIASEEGHESFHL